MEIFFIWFVGAVIVGIAGGARGRSGFGWFLLACLISPLLGLILVLVLPSKAEPVAVQVVNSPAREVATPSAATHRRCPECAEWILKEARKCKHCGSAVAPDPPKPKTSHAEVSYDQGDLATLPVERTFLFRSAVDKIFGSTTPNERELLRASIARDPENKLDPNAVRVLIQDQPVGFLPDAVAQEFEARVRSHFDVRGGDPLPSITVPAAIAPDPRGGEKLLSVRLPRQLLPSASN